MRQLTRAEITAVDAGGVDAVIDVIEQLQAVVSAQQEQIAALSAGQGAGRPSQDDESHQQQTAIE